jgi:NADH-ubiquinone oxidoreductase chain 6
MKDLLLNLLAVGAILSSVLVITSKNPVISVLYLILVFVNTALYLILLGIGFIGIAYVLVYIGAITVLILFVIMMINIKLVDILEVGKDYTKNLPLALLIGFVFLYAILSITTSSSITGDVFANETSSMGVNSTLNPISLQFITYPLELLTSLNQLFMLLTSPSALLDLLNPFSSSETSGLGLEIISNNFISGVNSVISPISFDTSFINFLQIEMLGQGLYTYGAA